MKVETRLFGEIDVEDDKIITLPGGLVGFPDMKRFTVLYDSEKEKASHVMWFQSLDEPQFAMPVLEPNLVKEDYNPVINEELLKPLGDLTEDNLYVLVTLTVPRQVEKMSVNLRAPIIVNTDNLLGGQLIVDDDMPIRFPIYDILKKKKDEK
jgi:flagellar assembly factor FliW